MQVNHNQMQAIASNPENLSPESVEALLLDGDLGKLSVVDRLTYYKNVCDTIGLDWKTQPFNYLRLNGKLQLYPTKRCTDQLRTVRKISIDEITFVPAGDGIYCISAKASDGDGRTDSDIGAVETRGLSGTNLANAMKKAVTQAKRRVTLSICGLGMLDETEIEQIDGAETIAPNAVHKQTKTNYIETDFVKEVAHDQDQDVVIDLNTNEIVSEMAEEHMYISELSEAKTKKGATYLRMTVSIPEWDHNGLVQRTDRNVSVFDEYVQVTCKVAYEKQMPVILDMQQSGQYWNVKNAQTVSLNKPKVEDNVDELPF